MNTEPLDDIETELRTEARRFVLSIAPILLLALAATLA
jgi:hypothetical protein